MTYTRVVINDRYLKTLFVCGIIYKDLCLNVTNVLQRSISLAVIKGWNNMNNIYELIHFSLMSKSHYSDDSKKSSFGLWLKTNTLWVIICFSVVTIKYQISWFSMFVIFSWNRARNLCNYIIKKIYIILNDSFSLLPNFK